MLLAALCTEAFFQAERIVTTFGHMRWLRVPGSERGEEGRPG